jgi:hypothetical protein
MMKRGGREREIDDEERERRESISIKRGSGEREG